MPWLAKSEQEKLVGGAASIIDFKKLSLTGGCEFFGFL